MRRVLTLLVLAAAFQPAFAQSQFFDVPKAAVQFDGVAKSGSYNWSGTNLVVTTNSHYAFTTDDHVYVSFTNSALNGYYAIKSVSGNSLTLDNTRSGSGSGTANVRAWVKAALNIASVVPQRFSSAYGGDWIGGYYRINFDTRFVDDRYIAVGGLQYWRTTFGAAFNNPPTASYFEVHFFDTDGSRDSPTYASFAFFGTLVGEP